MEDISKMTLELLMNKKSYNRYIENADPIKYQERQNYFTKIRKYKTRILDLTRQYIDNPDLQITTEMNDIFSEYTRIFIKYFEMKDLEESCCFEWKKEEDEDVLFDPKKMELQEHPNEKSHNEKLDSEECESNDNESIVVHSDKPKKQYIKYTLDAFMKRSK